LKQFNVNGKVFGIIGTKGKKNMEKIPAEHFVCTVIQNINNKKLSDKEFRQFIRNTLPIVETGEVVDTPLIEKEVL